MILKTISKYTYIQGGIRHASNKKGKYLTMWVLFNQTKPSVLCLNVVRVVLCWMKRWIVFKCWPQWFIPGEINQKRVFVLSSLLRVVLCVLCAFHLLFIAVHGGNVSYFAAHWWYVNSNNLNTHLTTHSTYTNACRTGMSQSTAS